MLPLNTDKIVRFYYETAFYEKIPRLAKLGIPLDILTFGQIFSLTSDLKWSIKKQLATFSGILSFLRPDLINVI